MAIVQLLSSMQPVFKSNSDFGSKVCPFAIQPHVEPQLLHQRYTLVTDVTALNYSFQIGVKNNFDQ